MQIFTQIMKNKTFSHSPKVACTVGSYYFICPGFKKCTLEMSTPFSTGDSSFNHNCELYGLS